LDCLKYILLLLPAISLSVQVLFGQVNSFSVGIQAGLTQRYLYGSELFKEKHLSSAAYSVSLQFTQSFKNHFSIVLPIGYEKKGSLSRNSVPFPNGNPGGYADFYFDFHYLTFPLLFRASLGNKWQVFLEAGPMFAYLLLQQTKLKSNVLVLEDQSMTGNFKRNDFGICSGAGSSIAVTKRMSLGLSYRCNAGLKALNLYKLDNNGQVKTMSHTFSFFLDYFLFRW